MELVSVFPALVALVITAITFLTIGYLILSVSIHFTMIPFRGRIASSFLVGAIVCVVLESIWVTKANSVFIVTLCLVLLFILQLSKNEIHLPRLFLKNLKSDFSNLLIPFFGFVVFAFLLQYLAYFQQPDWANALNSEWSYYALLANSMSEFGIENNHLLKNMIGELPASYYHYFDLWLIEMIGSYTSITYGIGLGLVVFPIIKMGVLFFVWAFLPLKNTSSFLWSIMLLFLVSFISWPVLSDFSFLSELPVYEFGLFTENSKRVYFLVWLALGIAYFLRQNRESKFAMLLVSIIPICHFGTVPFLCVFAVLLVLFGFLKFRQIWILVCSIVMIVAFYFVFNKGESSGVEIGEFVLLDYLWLAFKIVVKNIGLSIITIVHVIVVLALLRWKKQLSNEIIYVAILGLLASLGVWGALHFLFDSVQLFMIPFKSMFITITLISISTKFNYFTLGNRIVVLVVILMGAIIVTPTVAKDTETVACQIPLMPDNSFEVIGFTFPNEAYRSETDLSMQFRVPWIELPFLYKNKYPVSVRESIDQHFDNYVASNFSSSGYNMFKNSSVFYHYENHKKEKKGDFATDLNISQVVDCKSIVGVSN